MKGTRREPHPGRVHKRLYSEDASPQSFVQDSRSTGPDNVKGYPGFVRTTSDQGRHMTEPETHAVQPPVRRRVTLQDVAEAVGVSVTSASRSLHGARNGARSPSAATVDRVRRTAEALGYTRDEMASGLRRRQSQLIGVLVPRLSDVVIATIYDGIEAAAKTSGYHVVVSNTNDEPDGQRALAQVMLDHRVDGLIIGDAGSDGEFVSELEERDVRFVLVNRRAGSHVAATCDDVEGGRLVAEHLQAQGHRHVAVVAGDPRASTGADRTHGFRTAWATYGLQVRDELVVNGPFHAHGGRDAGRASMERILGQPGPPPTAVFAVSDLAALGAMDAIRAKTGLTVGKDIAVVGFHDIPLAADLPVPLTTVASPLFEMGEAAVRLLLDVLAGKSPQSQLLHGRLIVRESSSFILGQ